MDSPQSLKQTTRIILGTVIVLSALFLLAAGWTIPFAFESFSILYKFGLEKAYLRSGKLLGITLALLFFYQVLLASRLRIPELVFSGKRLITLHRLNGLTITFLVVCHPLLIKASENFTHYTFEKKYYPEFLGIAVLFVLLTLSLTAFFRRFFRLSHSRWLLLHRTTATLAIILMPAHILWVSETFESGPPRYTALALFSLNLLFIVRIWVKRLALKSI